MTPKAFLGLAVATVAAVAAAVVAVLEQPGPTSLEMQGEPAFPALRADPDAVAAITVRSAGQEVVLERAASDAWVAPQQYGYPAAPGTVRGLVVALTDMRLIEAKTAQPDRFKRLAVEDVDAAGANSRLVRLEDQNGQPRAEVLVGKERNRLTGTQPSGTYIRRPGEDQAWLASGRIELPETVQAWLDRRIIDIPEDEVSRVEVMPGEGPDYALVRTEGGDGWMLEGVDEALAEDAEPERLAGALAGLAFEDVKPDSEMAWPEALQRARVITKDGLVVTLRMALVDDEPWARLEAATTGAGADPAAAERARAIAERTGNWAYRLPRPVFDRLTRSRDGWLAGADASS